jgi:ABC-2 type transport system ATP-binding protein
MSEPLLRADRARIAVDGATAIDALSLVTGGDRVMLVGDSAALVAALTGLAPGRDPAAAPGGHARVIDGRLALLGRDVGRGEHHSVVGLVPLDPPMPDSWTVEEYVAWGARLGGRSRREGRERAAATLERLALAGCRRKPLRLLGTVARRAVAVAQALVLDPPALVLEAPLTELPSEAAAFLVATFARAAAGRAVLLSVGRLGPHGVAAELARTATDVCVLRRGRLVLHADPAALPARARLYELTVWSRAEALREVLARRGLDLRGGPLHFALSVPEPLGAREIVAAAAEARAPLTTCVPLL